MLQGHTKLRRDTTYRDPVGILVPDSLSFRLTLLCTEKGGLPTLSLDEQLTSTDEQHP